MFKNDNLKEQYIKFCANTEGVSIFGQPWFLDAVCGSENWNVCMDFAKNGEVDGVLVYHFVKKWGFTILKMPLLTAYMGLWIKPLREGAKLHQNTSQKRNVLKKLIGQLPQFSFFSQTFLPDFMYWEPFYWAKFEHHLMVTHIIEGIQDNDFIFNNFKENTQKNIRKAAKIVCLEKSNNPKIVYDIYERIQKRYGRSMSYSLSFLEKLHEEIQKHKAGQLYLARDTEGGQIHAALYIIWDKTTAYYWLGGSDELFRNSGALSFLIWEILKDVAQRGIDRFDFTGASAENLETYFTSFGAEKRPYLSINRSSNKIIMFLRLLKKLKNS